MPQRRGEISPKRLPNLPAEVWLHIFQFADDIDDRYTLQSLASVNKSFRSIALPVLFGTLRLSSSGWSLAIASEACDCLRRIIGCIQNISGLPHLLNAVRRLILVDWWMCLCGGDMPNGPPNDHLTDDSADYSGNYSEFLVLRSNACRELVSFVSNLPRLLHLHIYDSSFTLEILSRILRLSDLQTLNIECYRLIPSTVTLGATVTTSSLRVFQLDIKCECTYELHVPDIVELLIPIIGQLTILSLPSDIFCHLFDEGSLTTLPHLQKLSVTFQFSFAEKPYRDGLERIHHFFNLTPNLRELRVGGSPRLYAPLTCFVTKVPKLEILRASSHIASHIVPGLALEKIHIFTSGSRSLQQEYTVVSPNIKHIIYNGALNNPEEDLFHLAHAFPNAATLVLIKTEEYTDDYLELSEEIVSALPAFKHLKSCRVFAFENDYEDFDYPTAYCPIGVAFDPEWRSHPTIEDIQIFSFHRWFWRPGKGWHSVRSTDDPVEL